MIANFKVGSLQRALSSDWLPIDVSAELDIQQKKGSPVDQLDYQYKYLRLYTWTEQKVKTMLEGTEVRHLPP